MKCKYKKGKNLVQALEFRNKLIIGERVTTLIKANAQCMSDDSLLTTTQTHYLHY